MESLADLAVGQSAIVVDVQGEDSIALRLMEMGVTEGESIKLIGAAPFGDPLEVLLRGYKLSLRKTEAMRVVVNIG